MAAAAQRVFLDAAVLARLSRLTVNAREPMLGAVTGLHRSATRGSSVEFAEYRKYAPGDDIKHLDWRVFARTDRFYMKEFEADTNLRCQLVLDATGSMGYAGRHGRKLDYAIKLVATLAHLLVHQGDAVGLAVITHAGLKEIPPRRAPAHLRHIFDALADLKPGGTADLARALHNLAEQVRRRALVIVFSDFFAEAAPLISAIQHMRFQKHDLALFHLLDRDEVNFEFDRPIRFVDLESTFQLITDPALMAADYRRELDAHLEVLQRSSREFGADYQRVFTDHDYEQVLAAFILQRLRAAQAGGGGVA